MPIKVENRSSRQSDDLEPNIQAAVDVVPVEHLRGLSKIVLVDRIADPRLPKEQAEKLPAFYFPRVPGGAQARGEIALDILFPKTSFFKRYLVKAQLKANVVQCTLLVIAQHHIVTISGRKRTNPERAVREYVDRYFKAWRNSRTGVRARLARPLIPYLERWQRAAQKKYAEEAKRKQAS